VGTRGCRDWLRRAETGRGRRHRVIVALMNMHRDPLRRKKIGEGRVECSLNGWDRVDDGLQGGIHWRVFWPCALNAAECSQKPLYIRLYPFQPRAAGVLGCACAWFRWDWSPLSAVFFWWRWFRSCIEQLLPNVMQ